MFFRSLSASMAALLVAVFTFLPFLAQAPKVTEPLTAERSTTVELVAEDPFKGLDAGDISLEKFETFDRSLSDLDSVALESEPADESGTESVDDVTSEDEMAEASNEQSEQPVLTVEPEPSPEDPEAAHVAETQPVATEPAAPAPTEMPAPKPATSGSDIKLLGWFDSVDSIFARGETAIVTDLATGLKVTVARTGGTNHADCETTTSEQTDILLNIAEGSWNWTRRPVIVEVDGERIAASMTARPHAGRDDKPARERVSNRSGGYGTGTNWDSIKGNSMDGHFDIHFYGSKTHVNNSKDRKHQAAIQVAYHSED